MKKHKLIQMLSGFLLILSWVSVNIYLPALPRLERVFHTDENSLKLSLTLFFLCFAISQLFWGPISEKYGRKNPLLTGILITIIGGLIAAFSNSVMTFNFGRMVEAIGLGCAPVLGRAMLSDTLEEKKLSITFAYITIVANTMPALAPIIGGHLLFWLGWRSIFLFLVLYSSILYFLIYKNLPETHTNIKHALKIKDAMLHYIETCAHKKFMGYLFPYILVTGGMIGYYTVTPFIFITQLHISPENYGFYSLVTVATYILGAISNRFFAIQFSVQKNVIAGIIFSLIASVIFIGIALFYPLNILGILIPLSLYTFAAGFIAPSSNAGSLNSLRHLAGAGSAVAGTLLYGSSAIMSTIATSLSLASMLPLAIFISAISLTSFVLFYFFVGITPCHETVKRLSQPR